MIDVLKVRQDFPILKRKNNGKKLIYLDSTASALKPQVVIDAVNNYYSEYSVNIFRGIYKLSEKATQEYEKAREKVAKFIGCQNLKEVVFVRNTTEAINLVAYTWGRANIDSKSEIISTVMEHHANIVPWQQLALETEANLKYIDFDEKGLLDLESLERAVTKRTKLLAVTYISNVLGTINPVKEIVEIAKRKNPKIVVLIDGAQAVPHMKLSVDDIGCDFFAFSGHKMLGPTGIGVLWGKYKLLDQMPVFQMGGEMIKKVYLDKTVFQKPPDKFEAGTPHIAGSIGLAAAIDYLEKIGMKKIHQHEKRLTEYAYKHLNDIYHLSIYGPCQNIERGGIIAFNLFTKNKKLIHPHDVAQVLDSDNICVRSGHHCAMPLHEKLKIPASVRASFYIYNTLHDVDRLVEGIKKVKHIFK